MSAARAHRKIAAPVERVWAAATDVAGACDRMSGVERIELLTDGPFRVGTRWRETRVALDRTATEEMLVVECEVPRCFVLEVTGGDTVSRSVTTLEPAGPVVGALLGALAARAVLSTLNRDLDDLARWCEQVER
jgi:hypothetical protein